MSRRSSRKVASLPSYTEVDENIEQVATIELQESSPRKRRKVVVEEQVEVTARAITTTKRKADSKKQINTAETIGHSISEVAETVVKSKASPKRRKIKTEELETSITVEAQAVDDTIVVKKVKGKRKVKVEEEAEEELREDEDTKKVKKKRKTKEEKEAEAMPLAGRTSVQTLKRAMYIGAHVSGAGGKLVPFWLDYYCKLICCSKRSSQFDYQCAPYWRKCVRLIPEIPTEMDQSSSRWRGSRPIPCL
jgi:AP endonuclease-1